MQGLSLDQAPPVGVIFPFFLAAAGFATAAGVVLASNGAAVLTSPFLPGTVAFTHLGTLGFLMMVMMGAIYQMIPVVIGVRVRGIRLAHLVFSAMVIGIGVLVAGLLLPSPAMVEAAIWLIGPAIVTFLLPTLWAVLRASTKTETAHGMRLALLSLLGVGFLGIWMAHGHAGMSFPGDRWLFIRAHVAVGLFGWVGLLIVAVSFQVVPMFYLSREVPRWLRRTLLGGVALGVILPVVGLVLGPESARTAEMFVTWGPVPAMLALFVVHPAATLFAIRHRRRKRAHPSLRFWQAGLSMAPLVGASAIIAGAAADPRWDLLYGFLAVWGWAAIIVHGMLTRIVPFLIWFHRFSPLAGVVPIPSMNAILPARWTEVASGLHAASVLAGAAGIVAGSDVVLRIAGALIALTGLNLGVMITHVLRQRPAPPE